MDRDFLNTLRSDGLTWDEYLIAMDQAAAMDPDGLDEEDAEKLEFSKLNLHRTARIGRTWKPSDELAGLLARLERPQTWMVLTETWCGDSAQCLPMIAIMAEAAPEVTLRLMIRDDNLDVMDRYLTDGKRAIPLLVAYDDDGNKRFRWGARPAEAQAVITQALAEGLEKPDRLERLHLFYGRNRGRALDAEFVELLTRYLEGTP